MGPDNGMENKEKPKLWAVRATPNVSGLIRPTEKSKDIGEMWLVTFNAIETKKNI